MDDSLIQKIYDATNKGLDIILSYYPQANGCDRRGKFFKLRGDEKTASACMKEINGVWRVTDFGDEGTALSPIDICMREERLDFRQALHRLADRYGVNSTLSAAVNKPTIERRPATQEETEGTFTYELNEKMSAFELGVLGPTVTQQVCDRYAYYSVKSYSKVRNRMVTTISSTANYPIFMRECGTFRKIYQPLNPDKAYRFFYDGSKPKNYINGFDELKKAYEAHQKEVDIEEELEYEEGKTPDTTARKSSRKLPEAVICSGERDALNCAGLGYMPLWMNSETATLDEFTYGEIMKRVERLYNIPDIDGTGIRKGRELALQYIDIHTIELPEWLQHYKDNRGRPRKDLRDYVELKPSVNDFRDLVRMAKPCRFWEKRLRKNEIVYEINTVFMLNFLKQNGFGKIVDQENNRTVFVYLDGFKVREVLISTMEDFIIKWADERMLDIEIQNKILESKRIAPGMLERVATLTPNFKNNDIRTQDMFFNNTTVRVTSEGVETLRNGTGGVYAWAPSVSKHDFKRIDPAFTYEYNEEGGFYKFDIKHTRSHYFRFLINASRIYWKEEFVARATGDTAKDEQFARDHRWDIISPRLTEEEQIEQFLHLQNKIFAIGYLLHSYKSHSRAWCVWLLENKITEEDESSGGSGKTFMLRFLNNFKNMETINGRDKGLTQNNQFFLDRVTEATDILLIDDAVKYFDFNFFYSMITDNMVVNYKHSQSKEINFKESPKIAVSSNFPPPANDGSTSRRILNCVFSDYYHQATDDNEYDQTVRIADDFGYELHNESYKWEWWNEDYNFCVDCLQFYLSTIKHNYIAFPPMGNVDKRMRLQSMGAEFIEWAEVFFCEGSENLNKMLLKHNIKNIFDPKGRYSTKGFTTRLRTFCKNADYIEALNPETVRGYTKNGQRIVRNQFGETQEYIYVKTYGVEVNDNI